MTPVIVVAVIAAVVLVAVAVVLLRKRSRSDVLRPRDHRSESARMAQLADRVVQSAAVSGPVPAPSALRDRLGKTRAALRSAFDRAATSDGVWIEVTEALVRADVGLALSSRIVEAARARVAQDSDCTHHLEALKAELIERLDGRDRSLSRRSDGRRPSVWLFVGVNGTGKTTTIGKLAKREADDDTGVVLAAGDTFRAGAANQLATWADRSGAHIVRGSQGADPASVVFDAIESAAARGADLVLADTAGRFHNEQNLMTELQKVRRVAERGAGQVTETLLVLDATTGQNGLTQARQFAAAVNISGVVLTKLDGSAKGGIVVAIEEELGAPVKLIGVGERIDDLVAFEVSEFVDALCD